ncbi:hypothetical protein [Streptomyces sp. NPDC052107]|uniref:hypothetical protein n=1 Tax=Streptomyces sp. NPDC052107 TaxID=3155632 RepID=UPI003424D8F2
MDGGRSTGIETAAEADGRPAGGSAYNVEKEAAYGHWPEPCGTSGNLIPRDKPSGAGRPPEYCSKGCQNQAKAARAVEGNAPGLPAGSSGPRN